MKARELAYKTKTPEPSTQIRDYIQWNPPPNGWVKLNCDGARTDGEGRAGCGGVVRNDSGKFCFAFSCNLGECSVLASELWAILYGARLAWERGFQNIIIESDSLLAINLLKNGCSSRHPCYALVHQIMQVIGGVPTIRSHHILREANQVADLLAKNGLFLDVRCRLFDSMPDFLSLPCLADNSAIPFPRGF